MPPNPRTDIQIEGEIKEEVTPLLENKGNDDLEKDDSMQEGPGTASRPSKWTIGVTMALVSTMLVQSFLLVSVFPYAGFLAMKLVPSVNEENAGRYAGFIGASFMAGRMFTSFLWGKVADRFGRKIVLKVSLLLSLIFSVLFGLAPTMSVALGARFILGLSNSLLGVVQTLIIELSEGDKNAETRGNSIVMGAWGYGLLLNPALGGYLSDPIKQYPDSDFVMWLDSVLNLSEFPFLLPNLVGAFFCLVSYILVNTFLDETLTSDRLVKFSWRNCVSLATKEKARKDSDAAEGGKADAGRDKDGLPRWESESSTDTTKSNSNSKPVDAQVSPTKEQNEKKETATIKSLMSRPATRKHLILYWVFNFLLLSIDETFPLYCMSKGSGLGVVEKMIGNLLSGAGFFYLILQFFLLTSLVSRFGLYGTMRVGSAFSIPMVALVPLTLITNRGGEEGTLTWQTMAFVSIVYAILRACASITIATINMTTNRTVPSHQRASLNGLATMGGSVVKAAGPIFAGFFFSESVQYITPPFGSVFVWSTISCMGIGFLIQTMMLTDLVDEDIQNV